MTQLLRVVRKYNLINKKDKDNEKMNLENTFKEQFLRLETFETFPYVTKQNCLIIKHIYWRQNKWLRM